MKKLDLTKNDLVPLTLLLISLALLVTGIILKSMFVIAGVTGLLTAWFLCIDNLIANHNMSLIKRIVFGFIVFFLPFLFAVYLTA